MMQMIVSIVIKLKYIQSPCFGSTKSHAYNGGKFCSGSVTLAGNMSRRLYFT